MLNVGTDYPCDKCDSGATCLQRPVTLSSEVPTMFLTAILRRNWVVYRYRCQVPKKARGCHSVFSVVLTDDARQRVDALELGPREPRNCSKSHSDAQAMVAGGLGS